MSLTLHAYPPSVYCQIVRMALAELGLTARIITVDPFTGTGPNPHPFALVPTLTHDGFQLFETIAILRYLDDQFAGGRFSPGSPRANARMAQVQSIVDSHAYWPLVRIVFSHRIVAAAQGIQPDEAEIAQGLARAETVLSALDNIAGEALVLDASNLTLADFHLAPMIGFFAAAPEGAAALARFPALDCWFRAMSARPSYRSTCPPLTRHTD